MPAPSRRHLLAVLLLPLATSAVGVAHAQASPPPAGGKHRLVFQVTDNDPARWTMVLNNVRNAQVDVGGADKIDIEIVSYGPGISMLKKDSPVGDRINELVKSGVQVVGCENTMAAFKMSKDEMLASIGYVPAGVTELMKKQQQGWAYIRP